MNAFQTALVKTFAAGDYAHVTTLEEATETGDKLFRFLFIELSDEEDCLDEDTAVQRMNSIISELNGVIDAF